LSTGRVSLFACTLLLLIQARVRQAAMRTLEAQEAQESGQKSGVSWCCPALYTSIHAPNNTSAPVMRCL